MKLCRQYLMHIQNSLFEGEITEANFRKFLNSLKNIIDESSDSIVIYSFKYIPKKLYSRVILGIEKRPDDFII